MRWPLLFLLIGACAQPLPEMMNPGKADGGGGGNDLAPRHDLRGGDGGGTSPDFAGADLAGADLAGAVDLAVDASTGVDLGTLIPPDLSTMAPPDMTSPTPPDLLDPCAGAGGACSTGQPGVCAAGTWTCTAGSLSCVRNQAPAARENCFNTLDDDCSGDIDNGCPIAVGVGTPAPLYWVGGSGGGSGSVRCPAGQFAGAVRYFYDEYDLFMAGMGLFCTAPTLTKGASSYSVTTSSILSVTPIVFAGSAWDYSDDSNNCVAGGALGTVWRHALTGEDGALSSGYYVDGIETQCGAGSVSFNSTNNTLSFSFTPTGSYTGWSYTNDAAWIDSCPTGSVLVGYDYRIGSWLDAIRPVCAPLTVTYK